MTADQLRKSRLQQAMQGKLVPQDPKDEPASVLLECIREEKARLVKEKKAKREKNPSIIYRGEDNSYYEEFTATGEVKCVDDEIPFDLPKGWEWTRLGELADYRKGPFGSSLTKSMFVPCSASSIKVYEQKNAIQKNFSLGEYYITQEKFAEMRAFEVCPNDIIVSCAGTIGETYILPQNAPIGVINQALMRVSLFERLMSEYWRLLFEYVITQDSLMKGTGSAIKNIPPFEYLKKILVPLPPLAEQERIVAKIEELMPWVEQYGKAQSELDQLNNSIQGRLRKSILQYAIKGKLVPQQAEDGSAEELLAKIQAEKQRLYATGKLKKKDLAHSTIFRAEDGKYYEQVGKTITCIDEEIPFDLPESWRWVRICDIGEVVTGGTPAKENSSFYGGRYPLYKPSDLNQGFNTKYASDMLSEEGFKKARQLPIECVLVTCIGASIGKVGLTKCIGSCNQQINAVAPSKEVIIPLFLYFVCSSGYFQTELKKKAASTTIEIVNKSRFSEMLVALPPLAEQQRIVSKLEEVLGVLNGLGQ